MYYSNPTRITIRSCSSLSFPSLYYSLSVAAASQGSGFKLQASHFTAKTLQLYLLQPWHDWGGPPHLASSTLFAPPTQKQLRFSRLRRPPLSSPAPSIFVTIRPATWRGPRRTRSHGGRIRWKRFATLGSQLISTPARPL